MKNYHEMSAVVTGGASGLGYATAKRLTKAGVKVAIFDLNAELGEKAAKDIGCVFCPVNITSEEEVEAGFAQARAANGQERILVNCAGKGGGMKTVSRDRKTGEIKRHSMEFFEQSIQLNLIGTFRMITASAAGMMTLEPVEDGERGVIVNTASVAAVEGQVGQVAYSAGKGGICGMTLTIARDLANEGIRVNTILPGIFATPPLARLDAKIRDSLNASVPFPKRMGQPDEYADLVETLIRNTYFNGQTIRLDGAIRMAPR